MKCITLLTCLVCLIASAAGADTYIVRPDGTGDYPTIQAAVDASADGDVIQLTDGVFMGDGNRDVDFLGKAITVESQSGDPELCIIDCQGSEAEPHRGFIFQAGEGPNSILQNVQITGGYVQNGYGGAIKCNASPTITGCQFYANTAEFDGGAVSCHAGTAPVITGCKFIENDAMWTGGGMYLYGGEPITVSDCEFIGNRSLDPEGSAGGLAIHAQHDFTLLGCYFEGNEAYIASAMRSSQSDYLSVIDCYFVENSASLAGTLSIFLGGSEATVSWCTFAGNEGPNFSGIRFNQTDATVSNCTFYGNQSLLWTGGTAISLWNSNVSVENSIAAYASGIPIGLFGESTVSISCCDFFGNSHGDWYGAYADQRWVNGNLCCDPVFCDLTGGDYTLAANSPCAPFTLPNEDCDLIGAWPVDPACIVTAAPEDGAPSPVALLRAVPNPFNPKTEIRFELSVAASVTLEVFDLAGRRVATLLEGRPLPAGAHVARWDGRDDAGMVQPSGLYFCRLDAGGIVETGKMTLLK